MVHKPWLIHHYFDRSWALYPGKTAVTCGDREATYTEVGNASIRLADQLLEAGVARGECIPLFIPKSIDAIFAMLAVLRVGSAYVPLDVDSPASRIISILRTTGSRVVLANQEGLTLLNHPDYQAVLAEYVIVKVDETGLPDTHDAAKGSDIEESIAESVPTRFVDHGEEKSDFDVLKYSRASAMGAALLSGVGSVSVDLAYVLFTSGSTGAPKGVMISHQAIIDYIDWCVAQFRISSTDQIANHAPLYFDNSTFDIYTAFASGATLHLIPPGLNSVLPRLVSWLRQRKISVFFCVPSVLTLLLKSRRLQSGSLPDVRELVFAGEVVQPDVLTTWMEIFPHMRFTNMYGPTEITVDCTFHVVDQPPRNNPVPIGRARPNMEVFVAEEGGRLTQAPGATGELWVRGLSVGYGYLGDPDRTSQAFVQNPRSRFPDRLYRTGDLVTIREDGALLFLGRLDQQIKYLGHRIELGEIESQLQALPVVEEAVVVFHNAAEAAHQAIGALVSTSSNADSNVVMALLKDRVPGYMLPKVIVCTNDAFPRTPNGKYDRKAIASSLFDSLSKVSVNRL